MGDKPGFREFISIRSRCLKKDEFLYVYNRKERNYYAYEKLCGIRGLLYRHCIIILIFLAPAMLYGLTELTGIFYSNSVLRFMEYDIVLLLYIPAFLALYYTAMWLLYISTDFKEAHYVIGMEEFRKGQEINGEVEQEEKMPLAGRIFMVALFLLMFFITSLSSSFSVVYLRFLADGGSEGKIGDAWMRIEGGVWLDEYTKEGAIFKGRTLSGDKDAEVVIYTTGIPGKLLLFINGEEIDIMRQEAVDIDADTGHVWEENYFDSSFSFRLASGHFRESNTIEVKSGAFDKKWTFTLR